MTNPDLEKVMRLALVQFQAEHSRDARERFDESIEAASDFGCSYRAIADKAGISYQRVAQIVAERRQS